MKQYEMIEMSFPIEKKPECETDVNIKAEFIYGGRRKIVKGFYAGNRTYKVRFYPEEEGIYEWKLTGEVSASGKVQCAKSNRHGMVRTDQLHFKYDDDSKYLPFGTTIYALVHQPEELIETTLKTLSKAPFNKVRMCVFPKDYDYNKNEPEYFPFEKTDGKWDVNKPCYLFWDALEASVLRLGELGIECDLILFHPYDRWGFSKLSRNECFIYLDYLLRRLVAIPNIWWSLANEYDLMKEFNADWSEIAAFISANDPFGHLLSNHNCFNYWDFNNPNVTHCSVQDDLVHEVIELHEKYEKPVVYDECRYEGNLCHAWGSISAFEMVHRFWTAFVCGGYCTHGETYLNTEEVLWWSRGGKLEGESPERIAFLKEIMYSLPGPLTYISDKEINFSLWKIKELIKNGELAKSSDFWAKGLLTLPEERIGSFLKRNREWKGSFEDKAIMRYFGRLCPSEIYLELPSEGDFSIEVIDIWEMTRLKVLNNVNGNIYVKLPGKEGIAILALKQ